MGRFDDYQNLAGVQGAISPRERIVVPQFVPPTKRDEGAQAPTLTMVEKRVLELLDEARATRSNFEQLSVSLGGPRPVEAVAAAEGGTDPFQAGLIERIYDLAGELQQALSDISREAFRLSALIDGNGSVR